MKRIQNNTKKKSKELHNQMTYAVNHNERKVYFSKYFVNQIKNIASNEYKTYLAVMQRTKGYEVIIKESKPMPMYCI